MAEQPGNGAPDDPEIAALLAASGATGAWQFAAEAHAGQLRPADRRPAIRHPEKVAELVAEHGGDGAMVQAALLHDVLEDSPAEAVDVERAFGAEVGELVVALSDDRSISDYEARKRALRDQVRAAGPRAALIYAADKLANCADLRYAHGDVGSAVADRLEITLGLRVAIWRDDEAMCRELLGDTPLLAALADELDALDRDLASGPAAERPTP